MKIVHVRLTVLVLALTCALLGCSQDKPHAVYDIDNNPGNFPLMAVDVIKQIENGSLTEFDSITQTFGDLYTQQSDLLDNPEWKSVIDRLGDWFQKLADSLARQGLHSYTPAAEYYQLASFARPNNATLRAQAGLFGCWLAAIDSQKVNLSALSGSACSLEDVLAVSRYFLFGDSLDQRFFLSTLGPEIGTIAERSGILKPDALSQLSAVDRALLAVAGLADTSNLPELTTFAPVGIDLIAARISRIDSLSYRTEFYFRPHDTITNPLKVFLRIDSGGGNALPVEIIPRIPATSWMPGQMTLVTQIFPFSEDISGAAVGLCDFAAPQPNFYRPKGLSKDLFPLAQSALVMK